MEKTLLLKWKKGQLRLCQHLGFLNRVFLKQEGYRLNEQRTKRPGL